VKRLAPALCVALSLAGCASDVTRTPARFVPGADQQSAVLRIREPASLTLPTGYARPIKRGSVWRFVGTVPHGDVFQPVGDVYTIVGANAHEAYLVLASGLVVGFYLPGEAAFAPLSDKVRLITE